MKQIIFVLGMHRTGTSLLTSCLYHMLGLQTEHEGGNLMKATNDNPKGYFEDVRIVDLNEKILTTLGYSWDASLFPENNLVSDIPYSFFIEAKEILNEEFLKSNTLVIKDPRVSLLLPFWMNVAESLEKCDIKYIISLRNPYETAMSEYKRAASNRPYYVLGHKLDYSQRVWFTHYYEILKHINTSFLICEFEKLIEAPQSIVNKISEYLNLKHDENSVSSFINEFLSKDLRRNKIADDFCEGLPKRGQFIFDLYKELVKVSPQIPISEEQAKAISKHFSFVERVKDYCYPVKEFPLIVKRHLNSKIKNK